MKLKSPDDKVTSIVSRVALLIAFVVTLALPIGYWLVAYNGFSDQLEFKARVKATALSGLIATIPEVWIYAENRLLGLITREPVPLDTEEVRVYDERDNLLAQAGRKTVPPELRRSYSLFDGSRVAGRVEVSDTLRGIAYGTLIAAVLGILLGSLVFIALRTIPLRALREVTRALFEQKERAEVTLRSIGDGVITTDADARVEFLNPVAEQLSGWSLSDVRNRPLTEFLNLLDAASGESVAAPVSQALAENRIVSCGRDIDLVRRDGGRIGIDDSAAPIHGPDGDVIGCVLIFRDVSSVRAFTKLRSWEAAHDVLTGLVNRREFEGLVDAAVASAQQAGKLHVICYLDLDQFKVVNDTCGHAAGDDLLKELAGLLLSRIRKSDTLARLGGDEFGLLLDGCSLERAQFIAADLLAVVGGYRFNWETRPYSIGVSIGLATISGDSASGSEVLAMADTACYWAKEQGRNRVCVYRTGDSDMAARRRETGWVMRIKSALAEDRFMLYHQSFLPLNVAAGGREHIEVLLRMIDEEGNLIQPGSFLPAAERFNLMPAIDRWVVSTLFVRYHELVAARGGGPLTCAINLSGTTLNAEGFPDFIRQLAIEYALPPQSICFEITETAAINNLRKAAEFIKECKSMGFLFALDDFGTGTSSFGYLKNLPIDYLKIDGGFVRNLEHDAVDKAMTEAINRIGHIMGIKTIAEYAENDSIIQGLISMGVDYAQGYGVCMPTPLFEPGPRLAPLPELAAAVTV
jgi:diguanylate cyclase (GGDEF)-like protein/PAS domain S-box-containing protein